MLNWIKKLFGKKKEEELPLPDHQPTELIQKVYDWIMSISKEDMISQRDDDYGVDITCLKWREDGYRKTRYRLSQGNYAGEKIDRRIEILRLESLVKDCWGCYSVSYFIMELKNGDVLMDKNDMLVDNVNLDNKKLSEVFSTTSINFTNSRVKKSMMMK